jgi:hypothetical protein
MTVLLPAYLGVAHEWLSGGVRPWIAVIDQNL